MLLHAFVFLLVICFLLSLARLGHFCWFHLRPSSSRGRAKRNTLHRLLKPRCPDDCPVCRLAFTTSSGGGPASASVCPWSEVKSRRGAPKRVNTEGFACPNQQCPYFGITAAQIHALVGDGIHGRAERIQTFRCQACRTTFTSRRTTCIGYLGYPFEKMRHGGRYPVLFRSCDPASREQYGCSLCCFLLCFRTDILSSQYSSCHNVPPRIAHPDLPHLPALPSEVDPDRWVDHLHGRAYVRHVGADGCVTVDERSYYVGLQHKGKLVALLVNAPGRCFEVWEGRSLLKRLPIKGLQGAPMPLERFIAWMREQAIAEERRGKFQTRAFGWRQLLLWDNASA